MLHFGSSLRPHVWYEVAPGITQNVYKHQWDDYNKEALNSLDNKCMSVVLFNIKWW